jgi:hypothetical protein
LGGHLHQGSRRIEIRIADTEGPEAQSATLSASWLASVLVVRISRRRTKGILSAVRQHGGRNPIRWSSGQCNVRIRPNAAIRVPGSGCYGRGNPSLPVLAWSRSDFGVRKRNSGRASADFDAFDAPFGNAQRESGEVWTALPPLQPNHPKSDRLLQASNSVRRLPNSTVGCAGERLTPNPSLSFSEWIQRSRILKPQQPLVSRDHLWSTFGDH